MSKPKYVPQRPIVAYDYTLRLNSNHELLCQTHFDRHANGGMLAGQAFTAWRCKRCGTNNMHHNTATPQACLACAVRYEICQRCLQPVEESMLSIKSIRKGEDGE